MTDNTPLFSISNLISLCRLTLSLGVVGYVTAMGVNISGAVDVWIGIFTLLLISDGIDGHLARRLDQVTENGAILDQLADVSFNGALCMVVWAMTGVGIWIFAIIGVKAVYEAVRMVYPALNTPIPGFTRWGKLFHVVSSVFLIMALWPFSPMVQITLAGMGVAVVMVSFAMSTMLQIGKYHRD